MQTKIMLALTVVVIACASAALAGGNGTATTATHPPLSTACRRLTTARIRSGSTAKARSGYEEVLKRSDKLALVSERLRPACCSRTREPLSWIFHSSKSRIRVEQ